MEAREFIDSIENELFNRIRNSKSDAEARRLLKEQLAEQLPQLDVISLLIAWEQYKKDNWWESDAVDVEKVLIERFKEINYAKQHNL